MYLAEDTLLGVGEGEGDMLLVESVEEWTDMGPRTTHGGCHALLMGVLVVELKEEKLFELETGACGVELRLTVGIVDGLERLIA